MYKHLRVPVIAYQNLCIKQEKILRDLKMFKPDLPKRKVPLTKVLTFVTSKETERIPYIELRKFFLEKKK